jgi:osmotically-inducible protein OsmY
VQLGEENERVTMRGMADSEAQRAWMEQLAGMSGGGVESRLRVGPAVTVLAETQAPAIDDESLQALVVFRLRLAGQGESRRLRIRAHHGVVTLQGKVNSEARRQRVENMARSTLGVRELRSSLTLEV